MFEWLFSKLSSNRSRNHSRKHRKTSRNEHHGGNDNRNDGGYTSAHRKPVSNNKQQRPPDNAREGNTPPKPVPNHATTVPRKQRTGHTRRLDSPKDLEAMTWHVFDTINRYQDKHQHKGPRMDLVILSGLFDVDLKWSKPHGNQIRFICNNDGPLDVSLSRKIADALTQYVGSSYPKVKAWAPDDVLDEEVRRSLCQEALKERNHIFPGKYALIMPAPLSWRICEALDSREIEKAARLLAEYISNHEERLADEQEEKNAKYKRNKENKTMLPCSGCKIPCSLAMVSINQILVWAEQYGFEHVRDNAKAVDKHFCQNNQQERHKHKHLICKPRSGSLHDSSSHSNASSSKTRPPNSRNDSAVELSIPPHIDSRKRSPSREAKKPSHPRRDATSTSHATLTHGAESTKSTHGVNTTEPERQGRSGSERYERQHGFAAGGRLITTPTSNPPNQTRPRKTTYSRSPSRPRAESRSTNTQDRHAESSSGGHHRKPRDERTGRDPRIDSAHSRERSRQPQKPTISVDFTHSQIARADSEVPSHQPRERSKERRNKRSLNVPSSEYDPRDKSPRRTPISSRKDRSPYSASSYSGSVRNNMDNANTESSNGNGDVSPLTKADMYYLQNNKLPEDYTISPVD